MSDKYRNENGVYIDVHTDRRGREHIDIYDRDLSDSDHSSIHINWDSSSGSGSIIDTTDGSKDTTDIDCYLTTACMKHLQKDFDDNCEELTILRWFRDNFVSNDDVAHYYAVAPVIVEAINSLEDNELIYNCIYQNVVDTCVKAIKNGNYEFAYNKYKSSVLKLEEQFARPVLESRLTKILVLKQVMA